MKGTQGLGFRGPEWEVSPQYADLPRGLVTRTSSTTYCWKKGCAKASSAEQQVLGLTTKQET